MSISPTSLRTKLARAVAIASAPDAHPALVAVRGPFLESMTAYKAADKASRDAAIVWAKEAPEAAAAMLALGTSYDIARDAALARVPGLDDAGPSSRHTMPEQTLEAAADLIDSLAEQDPAWAKGLIDELQPKYDTADKELSEKIEAGAVRQKADLATAQAIAVAHEHFLDVRRVVRRVHGPRSRQYHSLRDRIAGESEAEYGVADDEGSETAKPVGA